MVMNVNPLSFDQRQSIIACLASGLGPNAPRQLDCLSDGALRTIHADWQQRLATDKAADLPAIRCHCPRETTERQPQLAAITP